MSELPPPPAADRPPRPAATIVVVRDAPGGLEVLLSRRTESRDHLSGAWVFPGGVVDARDRAAHAYCSGLDDAAASARLGLVDGGLDYHVAAVRECFEEAGLLFAADDQGRLVNLDDAAGERLGAWRGRLHRGEASIVDFCRDNGLKLAVDRLVYFSHWLTPLGRLKRFDTRFFVAAAPPAQTEAHDGTEILEHAWLRPADALARAVELKLLTPTQKSLEAIARFPDVASLLTWAAETRERGVITPRMGSGRDGMRPVMPGEPAYAELGRIDPRGTGSASYDIVPDVPVRLSERVIRVTANNGSVMTGPGTNAYLVGGGAENEWAVIDPGPNDAAHVDAILAAAPGKIRWIFVTHTHTDHSPAAKTLAARTGAPVYGRRPAHPQWQDPTFTPDTELAGGERFELPGPVTLQVVHTPGHASNHLCYRLEEEKLLFTGDHVMQLSTVVINPPDGDMAAYIASLRELMADELDWLAPGHGFLMPEPRRAIDAIITHRLKREAKVVAAMRALGPATAETLLTRVYDDVQPRLLPAAMRSLTAHLLKLRDDARAVETETLWSLTHEEVRA
jgi:glyoxylase-like metal-dependent hydrolase (beta-lactamase superfamily II)/8-oxo-dGTP pyrophosphatase MutT (NUDIX family)